MALVQAQALIAVALTVIMGLAHHAVAYATTLAVAEHHVME